jgi:hypothetical protein
MLECTTRYTGCRVVMSWTNACAAVSTTLKGGWGAAWAESRLKARAKAVETCRQHGNAKCNGAVVNVCTPGLREADLSGDRFRSGF